MNQKRYMGRRFSDVERMGCPIGINQAEARECPEGGMPLAMVITPEQHFCDIYSVEKGFSRGTIFARLDKPFMPNTQKNGGICNECKF